MTRRIHVAGLPSVGHALLNDASPRIYDEASGADAHTEDDQSTMWNTRDGMCNALSRPRSRIEEDMRKMAEPRKLYCSRAQRMHRSLSLNFRPRVRSATWRSRHLSIPA